MTDLRDRIHNAWVGRVSGCMLGKPVELLSMREGTDALTDYLTRAGALPLRDYVPLVPDTPVERHFPETCKGRLDRSVPDDDINYSVLALMMLEQHGMGLTTEDVARGWLNHLPGAMVFTAERDAYVMLLQRTNYGFGAGGPAGFDVTECADNPHNDWIGAQIRADVYGWVCPGRPAAAAELARRDASLSHRGEGVFGAMAVAAMGAAIAGGAGVLDGVDEGLRHIPADSACFEAASLGRAEAVADRGAEAIRERYGDLSPAHTVNNLALVVWGLVRGADDFDVAIGDTVAAGWDTDCNGATVGALWGLTGRTIPRRWSEPWRGRIETSLAGVGELDLDDLVDRTMAAIDALR